MIKAMDQVESISQVALHNFQNGLNCCESVLEAILQSGVLSAKDATYNTCAMCAGFGGGVGMSGMTCGALSGAILAVGAKHGRKDPKSEKPNSLYDGEYRRYNNMVHEFAGMLGSSLCRDICQQHLSEWSNPARKKRCNECIIAGVQIACQYLDLTKEEVNHLPWRENVAGKQ